MNNFILPLQIAGGLGLVILVCLLCYQLGCIMERWSKNRDAVAREKRELIPKIQSHLSRIENTLDNILREMKSK